MTSFFDGLFDVLHAVAIAGLALLLFRPSARAWFERRCIGDRTAVDLAWIRIVTCSVLLLYVATEDLASQAELGASWFAAPGYAKWMGRETFVWFMSSASRLHLVQWILVALLGLAAAGVATRLTVALSTVVYLLFAALVRSFGKEFHEGYIGFYVLIVLCFTPCGDAVSVDAKRRAGPPREAAYAWSVWACWAAACVPYVQLGLSKLIYGGLYWFEGRSLRNYMLTDDLNLTEWNIDLALRFHDAPVFLFTIAGFLALLSEVVYVSVLLSPRLRRIVPAFVALLHLGVWFGQDALFIDATLIPLIFYVPTRLRRWS